MALNDLDPITTDHGMMRSDEPTLSMGSSDAATRAEAIKGDIMIGVMALIVCGFAGITMASVDQAELTMVGEYFHYAAAAANSVAIGASLFSAFTSVSLVFHHASFFSTHGAIASVLQQDYLSQLRQARGQNCFVFSIASVGYVGSLCLTAFSKLGLESGFIFMSVLILFALFASCNSYKSRGVRTRIEITADSLHHCWNIITNATVRYTS